MTVNNFEQIKSMLVFDTEDDFYHLQILKRKKEHPDLGSNSLVLKTYYISSVEYLEMKRLEIINISDFGQARAYINLNRRSFEKIAYQTLMKVTSQIMNKDFRSTRKAYESVCGAHSNEKNRKWILDIDWKDYDIENSPVAQQEFVNRVKDAVDTALTQCDKCGDTTYEVQTKNGVHLITPAFNPQSFMTEFPKIDIQKNNPTILYIG